MCTCHRRHIDYSIVGEMGGHSASSCTWWSVLGRKTRCLCVLPRPFEIHHQAPATHSLKAHMPNPNSSVITDYAPPVIRAPSPPSSVGSDKILLPDLPDPDKDLTPAELERKIEESLGLHRQRHEEILAEEDPLIPKPKNEEEANGMSWQQASMISISSAARTVPQSSGIPPKKGR